MARFRNLRTLSIALIATLLITSPGFAAVAETNASVCGNSEPSLNSTAATVDRDFKIAAQSRGLRPFGAVAINLEPGLTATSQVAVAQRGNHDGYFFARRNVIQEDGRRVPAVAADSYVGLDRSRDVLWARIHITLPGERSIEYLAEFDAREFPSFDALPRDPAARQLLVTNMLTAGATLERATVSHAGIPVTVEEGEGSLDRSLASLDGAFDKSSRRTRCRNDCARRYLSLAPGAFEIACLLSVAVVCGASCYVSLGTACVACLSWGLASAGPACGGFEQVVSLFRWYRCYRGCR